MRSLVACNELMIAVIKMKIARQLQGRWLFGIASVAPLLLLREEHDRHASPSATPPSTDCSLSVFSIGVGYEHEPRRLPPTRNAWGCTFSKPMLNLRFSLP